MRRNGSPSGRSGLVGARRTARSSAQSGNVGCSELAPGHAGEVSPPLQAALIYLDLAAGRLGLDPGTVGFLKTCKAALEVNFPVKMDDGSARMFTGYRVHHNLTRGPAKGGVRYHPLSLHE